MKKKGILYSTGQLDCLSYYAKIFPKIKSFVRDREIATKTFIPESKPPFILHRGSDEPKLKISDLHITKRFLNLRVKKKLHQVENRLSEKEKLTWRYFVPRKLAELHYACNYELPNKTISRIFIDVDAGKNISESQYIKVIKELLKQIRLDKELKKLFSYKIKLIWTGASIHVYLLLNKNFPASIYTKYFAFTKNTFTTKWAKNISEKLGINVKAGHERKLNEIILDTSATPPGKLARCPYSLHLNKKGKLTGVSLPIKESDLNNLSKLKNLSPDEVLNLD